MCLAHFVKFQVNFERTAPGQFEIRNPRVSIIPMTFRLFPGTLSIDVNVVFLSAQKSHFLKTPNSNLSWFHAVFWRLEGVFEPMGPPLSGRLRLGGGLGHYIDLSISALNFASGPPEMLGPGQLWEGFGSKHMIFRNVQE